MNQEQQEFFSSVAGKAIEPLNEFRVQAKTVVLASNGIPIDPPVTLSPGWYKFVVSQGINQKPSIEIKAMTLDDYSTPSRESPSSTK